MSGRPREGIVLLRGAHQLAVANDLRDPELTLMGRDTPRRMAGDRYRGDPAGRVLRSSGHHAEASPCRALGRCPFLGRIVRCVGCRARSAPPAIFREVPTVEANPKAGMAEELLAEWRAAERESEGARAAAGAAGLAVETADTAKAAAAESEAAVMAAAEAVERAKQASDLARSAAAQASKAAQMIHAQATNAEEQAVETVEEADADRSRAAQAFRDAQARGFRPDSD